MPLPHPTSVSGSVRNNPLELLPLKDGARNLKNFVESEACDDPEKVITFVRKESVKILDQSTHPFESVQEKDRWQQKIEKYLLLSITIPVVVDFIVSQEPDPAWSMVHDENHLSANMMRLANNGIINLMDSDILKAEGWKKWAWEAFKTMIARPGGIPSYLTAAIKPGLETAFFVMSRMAGAIPHVAEKDIGRPMSADEYSDIYDTALPIIIKLALMEMNQFIWVEINFMKDNKEAAAHLSLHGEGRQLKADEEMRGKSAPAFDDEARLGCPAHVVFLNESAIKKIFEWSKRLIKNYYRHRYASVTGSHCLLSA